MGLCDELQLVFVLRVVNFDEVQSFGGAGIPCSHPVLGLQNLLNIIRCPGPATDIDQRAGDRPHHVVEEAVGLDLDDDEFSVRVLGPWSLVIGRRVADS